MTLHTKKYLFLLITISAVAACGTSDRLILVKGVTPSSKECFMTVKKTGFDFGPVAIKGKFREDYTLSRSDKKISVEVSCDGVIVMKENEYPVESIIDLGNL